MIINGLVQLSGISSAISLYHNSKPYSTIDHTKSLSTSTWKTRILNQFIPLGYPDSVKLPYYTRYHVWKGLENILGAGAFIISSHSFFESLKKISETAGSSSTSTETETRKKAKDTDLTLPWVFKDVLSAFGVILARSVHGDYFQVCSVKETLLKALSLNLGATFLEIFAPKTISNSKKDIRFKRYSLWGTTAVASIMRGYGALLEGAARPAATTSVWNDMIKMDSTDTYAKTYAENTLCYLAGALLGVSFVNKKRVFPGGLGGLWIAIATLQGFSSYKSLQNVHIHVH